MTTTFNYTAEALEDMFTDVEFDFAESFEFFDNMVKVSEAHGLLTDEVLEIDEDGITIRMTGDTCKYDSVEDAIEDLYDRYTASLIEAVVDGMPGLEEVDTTDGRNGYPNHIKPAAIGLDYDELKDILEMDEYKNRLEIVRLEKKAGWSLWERKGAASGEYMLDEDEMAENYGLRYASSYSYDGCEYTLGLIEK